MSFWDPATMPRCVCGKRRAVRFVQEVCCWLCERCAAVVEQNEDEKELVAG